MATVFGAIIKPLYLRARYVSSQMNDRRLGIRTTDELVAQDLGQDIADYYRRYKALPFHGIGRIMRRLAPSASDAFLDIGCGAGRVVSVAASYPFRRIIGIDIEKEFCNLAETNVRMLRQGGVRPEIICTDASIYRVPDDITVVFLYNPFRGDVLHASLTRILESFDREPRRIRLVYANPREHDQLMSMQRFRDIGQLAISWRPGKEWNRTQIVRFYDVEG